MTILIPRKAYKIVFKITSVCFCASLKKKLPPFKNQIEISIQSFSYQGKKKILHDINLTIPKGKVIALVGKTGSGKTTWSIFCPDCMI